MRWSLALHGTILIVLGHTVGCGHTEPSARGDAVALAPVAARTTAANGNNPPSKATSALPVAEETDAAPGAPEATALAAAADAGESNASTATATVRCLVDAGSPARTLIRLAHRARHPHQGEPACTIHRLALEIPSQGVALDLCFHSCGQFLFDSQKEGPSRVTYVCENDMQLKAGSVWVDDGVVFFEEHDARLPAVLSGARPDPDAPIRPIAVAAIACGTHPELQTSGRLESMGGSQ